MCVWWRATGTQVTVSGVSSPTLCRVGYIGGRVSDTGRRYSLGTRHLLTVNELCNILLSITLCSTPYRSELFLKICCKYCFFCIFGR